MTRIVYRRNRKTAMTRMLSAALAIVFTLSYTGVVHAVAPETNGGVSTEAAIPADATVVEVPTEPEAASQEEAPVEAPAEEPLKEKFSEKLRENEAPAEKPGKPESKPNPASEHDEDPPPADAGGYVTVAGNPRICAGGLKIDPPRPGTYTYMVGDVEVEVTFEITETDDGEVLSWSSTYPVNQVIVKGGPAANIYSYSGATSGSGLHAPLRPSNKWADVSWVGFCFGDGGGDPGADIGVIRVFKFNDANGNGEQDEGEGPLAGFTFHLMDGDETLDTAITDESGFAEFDPVTFGTYEVHEVPRDGWDVTTPGGYVRTVELETGVATVVFGNRPTEVTVPDVVKTFELVVNGEVVVDVDRYAVAYIIGGQAFDLMLEPTGEGRYAAEIEVPEGTIIEEWAFYAVVGGVEVPLSVTHGPETVMEDMTNQHTFSPGMVGGTKFIDADLDGAGPFDPDDTFGAGWTFVLEGPGLGDGLVTTSGSDGGYSFAGLLPGTYTVRELDMPAYVQVYPVGDAEVTLALAGMEGMANFVNRPAFTGVSVTKTVEPAVASPGDTVTWTIVIENTGELMLNSAEITDPLLGLVDLDVGIIMPHDTYTATYQWVVPADASGTIVNTVTVVGQPSIGPPVTDTDTAELEVPGDQVEKFFRLETAATLVPAPTAVEVDYAIDGQTTTVVLADQGAGVWLSGPLMLDRGTTITSWSVHAVVDGARWPTALFASTTPEVIDPPDAGPVVNTATYLPGTILGTKAIDVDRDGDADPVADGVLGGWAFSLNGGWASEVSAADGSFVFGGLLPGTFSITEAMTAEQEVLFDLISPVDGSQSVTVGAGQTVLLDPFVNQPTAPSISLEKTSSVGTALRGQTISYTFTVTNTGPWALSDVVVSDPMIPAVAAQVIPTLAPAGEDGDSFTFSVPFDVPIAQPDGPMVNVATVTAVDQFGNPVTDTATATVVVPAGAVPGGPVEITKTANVSEVEPGDTIAYTVTYRNTGDAPVQDFTVVDDYPEGLVTVVDDAGGTVSGGTITWTISEPLGPDESRTIRYTVLVDSDVTDGTLIDNVVSIPQLNVSDTERVVVDIVSIVPVVSQAELFLPFTGGEGLGLLGAALMALALGVALRRHGRSAVN